MIKTSLTETNLISQAERALRECLSLLPNGDVSISRSQSEKSQSDLIATLMNDGKPITLIVEVKSVGEPSVARQAILQLEHICRRCPITAVPFFVAPYISPQTAQICREEHVGYLDFAGNCHLELPGAYIHVEGKANPFAHSRKLNSLYQPKAERVLRVLLTRHPKSWRIQALAEEANVSVGQVYKVKQLLLEKEWLADANNGISLTKPAELLNDWRRAYRFDKHQQSMFHLVEDIHTIETRLTARFRAYPKSCAFTSFAAAAHYAAYASYLRTFVYIGYLPLQLSEMMITYGLDSVESGANVMVLTPYDDGVFYGSREEQGVSIVSPIQTYLDLKGAGGRAEEAAEHLLNSMILPRW